MDAAAIAAIVAAVIKTAVDLGPTIIKGVEEAKPFAEQIVALIGGQNVTQDQLDELLANVQALSKELQA